MRCQPLTDLIKKNAQWVWISERNATFFCSVALRTVLSLSEYCAWEQVRDRATLYLRELGELNGSAPSQADYIDLNWTLPNKSLETCLRQYLQNGATQPFDLVRPSSSESPISHTGHLA